MRDYSLLQNRDSALPPESEGRATLIPFDEWFDPIWTEVEQQPYRAMNESDILYQRKIERLSGKLLTIDEEQALIRALDAGRLAIERGEQQVLRPSVYEELPKIIDEASDAREELVIRNLRLAAWYVRQSMDLDKNEREVRGKPARRGRYISELKMLSGGDLDYSDRMQIASEAIIRAVDTEGASRFRFATIASSRIEASLRRDVFDQQSPLSIPTQVSDEAAALNTARAKLADEGQSDPSYQELEEYLVTASTKMPYLDKMKHASQSISLEVINDYLIEKDATDIANGATEEMLGVADLIPDPSIQQSVFTETAASLVGADLESMMD